MVDFLEGIAVNFYRGIGPDTQFIYPFGRTNIFIGQNNSGKSIILNLISEHICKSSNDKTLRPEEEYRGEVSGSFLCAIGISSETALENFIRKQSSSRFFIDEIKEIIDYLSLDGFIYVIKNKLNGGYHPIKKNILPGPNLDNLEKLDIPWQRVWSHLTNKGGGSKRDHWIPETLNYIYSNIESEFYSHAYLIPAKRILGISGDTVSDLSGRGLIDQLANLQNPSWNRQEDKNKFNKINQFLREVTGKNNALLEVPYDRAFLQVHMDNKVLPLSSLGTGIHEVVLLASFCTIYDGSIMCIEEPEIHLHPLLQKKLIRYLIDNTNSQYFIATHSNSFIDTPHVNIFQVSNNGESTRVVPALTKDTYRDILDDIGCHASDILQSNYVIWVEGPSDRIYLNHWINSYSPSLVEGIHYTIMFYGGALIRHLTASDDASDEFIKLRDLNRNMAIIFDSDKDNEDAPLKPNVRKIVNEMSEGRGIAWVTAGREIENYVDGKKIQNALKIIHPRLYLKPAPTGRYDNSFHFFTHVDKEGEASRSTRYKSADKVSLANKICEEAVDFSVLDLEERVQELTNSIRLANGIL